MIVNMLVVKVSCNKHLESIAPQTLRKLNTDFMCHIGSNLARQETLIAVIG